MKVFITGGTGFIGTHTVKRLAQTEHELYCLVRKTSDTQHLRELNTTLVTGDVTDRDSFLSAFGIARCKGGASYILGDHPIAEELRALGMGSTAVECQYAPQVQSMLNPAGKRLPL